MTSARSTRSWFMGTRLPTRSYRLPHRRGLEGYASGVLSAIELSGATKRTLQAVAEAGEVFVRRNEAREFDQPGRAGEPGAAGRKLSMSTVALGA